MMFKGKGPLIYGLEEWIWCNWLLVGTCQRFICAAGKTAYY